VKGRECWWLTPTVKNDTSKIRAVEELWKPPHVDNKSCKVASIHQYCPSMRPLLIPYFWMWQLRWVQPSNVGPHNLISINEENTSADQLIQIPAWMTQQLVPNLRTSYSYRTWTQSSSLSHCNELGNLLQLQFGPGFWAKARFTSAGKKTSRNRILRRWARSRDCFSGRTNTGWCKQRRFKKSPLVWGLQLANVNVSYIHCRSIEMCTAEALQMRKRQSVEWPHSRVWITDDKFITLL